MTCMKEIISYYYNFDLDTINENKNFSSFSYMGETFYFVFFNRTKEELNDLINIVLELKEKGIKTHDFILNSDDTNQVYSLIIPLEHKGIDYFENITIVVAK